MTVTMTMTMQEKQGTMPLLKTVDAVVSLDSFKSHITCSYICCVKANEKN